jgi:transketolase
VRLAALMGQPVTFVWTHDSIGLGEDGPTHQPVEHVWSLRNIPGLDIVRPADANETAIAWKTILQNTDHPAGLCLSRQNVPTFDRTEFASAAGTARGAYVMADGSDVILIGTGSEVQIAVAARGLLAKEGISARVVSMPSVEWFRRQDASYQEEVLPAAMRARVSVEAGITPPWKAFVGDAGESVGIDHYGASAAEAVLYREFGITAEAVAAAARSSIAKARG